MNMETKAHLNDLRIAPRKVRLVTDMIKGLSVTEAIAQLQFSHKDAARPILKLLKSAVANAVHNHQAEKDTLVITHTVVDGGAILYRWMPRAMGRATPIRKRTAHVTIALAGTVSAEVKVKAKTKTKAEKNEKAEVEAEAPETATT